MPPRFDVLIPDTNGILRGLSAPAAAAEQLLSAGTSWPSSLFSSRFDGSVVEESGYGVSIGDPDFSILPVKDSTVPVPWHANGEGRQALFRMFYPSGEPFQLDPQHALQKVIDCLAGEGLTGILATEFEFYLHKNNAFDTPDGARGIPDLYSTDEISRQNGFLSRLHDYAVRQQLALGNVISEYGAGQWEINLKHTESMRAVLEGILLRRLVRVCAAEEGKGATFMAKPYAGSSGSGMHIHISLWKDGKNYFADETILQHAVAGVLAISAEAMAFFAPYDNSYRRFMPGSYAPCEATWGHENRSVMVRIPSAATDDEKRLEFRLCGADVNPLIVAAALLAGIHWGLSQRLSAPAEQMGGQSSGAAALPLSWRSGLDALRSASILPRYFDENFLANYLCVKENEWRHHRGYISDYDKQFYGRVI